MTERRGGRDNVLVGGTENDNLWGDGNLRGPQGEEAYTAATQGKDFLCSEEGDDYLEGGGPGDTLLGSAGNDTLAGNLGDDALTGGDGNDLLTGHSGNDTLDGGLGNDVLVGAEGSDSYLFGKTSGLDTLVLQHQGNQPADADRIVFDASVLPTQLKFDRQLDNLVIRLDASVAGGNLQLTLLNYFQHFDATGKALNDALGQPKSDLKQFQFLSNNTVWTPADIASKVTLPTRTVTTSNGIDTLTTSESAGLTADIENLTASGSFDIRLVGNAGNNLITGNAGNNSLNGFQTLDDANAWVDWTAGNPPKTDFSMTSGTSQGNGVLGADTLAGGKGDDTPIRGNSRIARTRSPEGWKCIPSCTTVPGLLQYPGFMEMISLKYSARLAANQLHIHNERLAA